jgi:type IV pilus assembly protein PilW
MTSANQKGFTLVEIAIVLLISSFVMAAAFSFLVSQRSASQSQEQLSDIQQSLRTSLYIMTTNLMMAGYDPDRSGNFGPTYIGRTDINGANSVTATDSSSIAFTADFGTGNADNGNLDANETFRYEIFDFGGDGMLDLAQTVGGGGRQLVAENIIAMGLSYAYDVDNDKSLDTYTDASGTPQIIWAVDSDNNGTLDRNLDQNNDGVINQNDAPSLNSLIPGINITPPVQMNLVRAIKISLLAQSPRRDELFFDNRTYVIGQRVITPNNQFRHRSLERVVKCRNLGLL